MLESFKLWLLSQGIWNVIINLVTGAIIGAILGVRYSLIASRPKLIITGVGSGGTQNVLTWSINVSNRPSFLGQALHGEPARDVHAWLRPHQPNSKSYGLFWGQKHDHLITIEPGQTQTLELFHWISGTEGYLIFDNNGQPIAKFQSHELKFDLTLVDALERRTKIRLLVEFDDTHLINMPQLQILPPVTMRTRIDRAKDGLREFLSAFHAR